MCGVRREADPALLEVLPTSDAHRPGFDVPTLRGLQPHLREGIERDVARKEALQHAPERNDSDAFEGGVIRGDGDLEAARVTGRPGAGYSPYDGPECHGTQALDLPRERRVVRVGIEREHSSQHAGAASRIAIRQG